MSRQDHFKISLNSLFVHSSLFLVGIILASIFIYFSSTELKSVFFEKFKSYFEFSGISDSVLLILQECLWILLIAYTYRIPYGRIVNILILLYKGFSVGVVTSIACSQLGLGGLKYTFFLVLPSNLFYMLSLCIATQISFEITSNRSGRHSKNIATDPKMYFLCILLTMIGVLIESYYAPWMYKIIF